MRHVRAVAWLPLGALLWVCPGAAAWSQEARSAPAPGNAASGGGGVVGELRAGGARVTGLGERGGLAGWFVELGDGSKYSLYVTPDGHAVAGLLYGPRGEPLTPAQLRAAAGSGDGRPRMARTPVRGIPAGAKRAPPGLFEKSAAAFGFTLGRSGPLVVTLADPGCEFSKSTVEALGRKAVAGRFRLHVVPVGVLGGPSAEMAIRIASSADPALAWFGRDAAPPHRAGARSVEANNALFEAWGEEAVPLTAWTSRAGADFYAVGGIGDAERWAGEALGP